MRGTLVRMGNWKIWRLVILLALVAGLAWTLRYRSPIGRSLTEAATIDTPYKTEHEWAVRETATDIEKMSAFADKRAERPLAAQLPDAPWDSDSFASLASAAFNGGASPSVSQTDFHPSLTSLNVHPLADASREISAALASNMRDPRAHESAALVIGAFALRDAADQFTDVRWAMNRMTAHLAVAKALRQDDQSSPDGALARVILSMLANHQARAAAELAALGNGAPPEPMNAWVRALRLRLTQDWRALPEPASATRLEKLEYFRARRATVRRRRAAEELATVGETVSADFARIAQDSGIGVEDGSEFTLPALELELAEVADAYRYVNDKPMPSSLADALNHRASYLVNPQPAVIPWGAWAEFYQRHIAMNIGLMDGYYRYYQGNPQHADQTKSELGRTLGTLTMFPLGTLRWTKGVTSSEADMSYVADVVALSRTSPELITARAWVFFEPGSRAEAVPESMPQPRKWFTGATAKVPYEAGVRHDNGLRAKHEDLDALIAEAPTDRLLLTAAIKGAAAGPAIDRANGLLASRHDYDLSAIDAVLAKEKDEGVRAGLLRKACNLSSRDCLDLAGTLAAAGQEEEAAKEYEGGLSDPAIDRVAFALHAGWLIDYYYRKGRVDDAMKLANDAASVGSGAGYVSRGLLFEKMGRLDDAESDLLEVAARYQQPRYVLGFYYRRVEVAHDAAYEHKWKKWLAETFPKGLQPEPASMAATPKTGVFVYQDSERSQKAGIRSGDIIVGLEGWRVDTVEQYHAINSFFEHPRVKLTLWRGALVKVDAETPRRLFGTDIRTHPLKGWIE
jgi:hypothetical protein